MQPRSGVAHPPQVGFDPKCRAIHGFGYGQRSAIAGEWVEHGLAGAAELTHKRRHQLVGVAEVFALELGRQARVLLVFEP
jgi:hypothetical protein